MNKENARIRITQEFKEINMNPMANIGFSVGLPNQNNVFEWRCTIMGPSDTNYKNGLFYLKVLFPDNYPIERPEVRFITPIYHVNVNHVQNYGDNIDPLGHVCISTINKWKPTNTMRQVFVDIFALFYLGNPESPFSLERKDEMKNNRPLYEEKVKYFTNKYANIGLPYKEYSSWDFTYNPNNNKNNNMLNKNK